MRSAPFTPLHAAGHGHGHGHILEQGQGLKIRESECARWNGAAQNAFRSATTSPGNLESWVVCCCCSRCCCCCSRKWRGRGRWMVRYDQEVETKVRSGPVPRPRGRCGSCLARAGPSLREGPVSDCLRGACRGRGRGKSTCVC